MRIETFDSVETKVRWKIVWTVDYTDVLGEIVSADEVTGECCVSLAGETKTISFGPNGIRIVARRR